MQAPAPTRSLAPNPLAALLPLLLLAGCGGQAAPVAGRAPDDAALLARGEYIAATSGCHDCHTPGYTEAAGNAPREDWLVGSQLGWSGPWGTTYPSNLRLLVEDMDEAAWLDYSARLHARPPMPDFALRAMTEDDRRALYRLLRSLKPAGAPAPVYLAPGQEPPLPYVKWMLPPQSDAS